MKKLDLCLRSNDTKGTNRTFFKSGIAVEELQLEARLITPHGKTPYVVCFQVLCLQERWLFRQQAVKG